MDRRLIDYLPPVLRDVLEFQVINEANEPEFALAWADLERLLANQFLDTADTLGVGMWERELGLKPKGTDTLETRKIRIRSMYNLERPYTLAWLRQWCASVSEGLPYEIKLTDYTLEITTRWDRDGQVESIQNILAHALPANLVIKSENIIEYDIAHEPVFGIGTLSCSCFALTESGPIDIQIDGGASATAGLTVVDSIYITD